jgi:hypothetical protein
MLVFLTCLPIQLPFANAAIATCSTITYEVPTCRKESFDFLTLNPNPGFLDQRYIYALRKGFGQNQFPWVVAQWAGLPVK